MSEEVHGGEWDAVSARESDGRGVQSLSGGGVRSWVVPPGLLHFCDVYPPLKRWAKRARPSGTVLVGVQVVFVEHRLFLFLREAIG